MIKATEFFRRREGMSMADFLAYWRDSHTSVVLGLPGLRRYVQNPVVAVAGLVQADFNGVVEVWFDDLDAMRANSRSDYWPLVVEDEARFIDRQSVSLVLSEDFAPQPFAPGYRLLGLLSKPPQEAPSGFQATVVAALESFRTVRGVTGVTTDFPIPSTYRRGRTAFADAVAGLRFAELENLQQAVDDGVCQRVARDLGPQTRWLAVRERPIRV